MKKNILILVLLITQISFSQNENKFNPAIVDYFKKNAHDPKSYEFVDSKFVDTITVSDCAKLTIEYNSQAIESNKIGIKELEDKISELKKDIDEFKNNSELVKRLNESINRKKELLKRYSEINIDYEKENIEVTKFFKNEDIVCYIVWQKYRIKNILGALVLTETYFTFDKDYIIINISEELFQKPFESAEQKFQELYLKKI